MPVREKRKKERQEAALTLSEWANVVLLYCGARFVLALPALRLPFSALADLLAGHGLEAVGGLVKTLIAALLAGLCIRHVQIKRAEQQSREKAGEGAPETKEE